MADPNAEVLGLAEELIAAGIPVVYCFAVPDWSPGKRSDVIPPKGWSVITAAECRLDGVDLSEGCLAMVAGHGIDVMDVDAKDGGDPSHLPPIESFGTRRSPSNGWHFYVRSTGYAKVNGWHNNGKHLGDYCGGTPEGGSRQLVFLGGYRPKYPDGQYRTEVPIDLARCLEAEPDPNLIALLEQHGARKTGNPGKPAYTYRECREFLAEHSTEPQAPCPYGRGAVKGLLAQANETAPGDPVKGRHAWAIRTAPRLVELMVAGCAWRADWLAFEAALAGIKPEEDPWEALAWSLANADGGVECRVHRSDRAGAAGCQSLEDRLFDSRDSLRHIRDFARARRAGPLGTLGVVLTRVIGAMDPSIVLPPIVGGHASLNLFAALVGESGSGKGACVAAGTDAVRITAVEEAPRLSPGSGEGIAHMFAHRERGEVVMHTNKVILDAAEVDTLTALNGRQGATLDSELRKAWSGERLGFGYVDPTKRIPVESHTYRMCLNVGVQPARAEPMFKGADGGTPQRFVWLPVTDANAPMERPLEPAELVWSPPLLPTTHGLTVLRVCDQAKQDVETSRLATLRGQAGNQLDGHLGLARLKIAAALALLDGSDEIRDEDWGLAGLAMTLSDRTRGKVQDCIEATRRAGNRSRAEAEAERALHVEDRRGERGIAQATTALLHVVSLHAVDQRHQGAGCKKRCLKDACRSTARRFLEEAIQRTIASGQLVSSQVGRATEYSRGRVK